MTNKTVFNMLVEKAMAVEGRNHMRPVIEKELLHYDILFALDRAGLLDQLTFQGGTALRLCYGADRFSEDLDFVGGADFASMQLMELKTCLEDYLSARYGLLISIKEPKELRNNPNYDDIKVDKWQISVTTSPEHSDLPRQKIKIEIANVPAYTRVPRPLLHNYDFLPDGYRDTLVLTESLDEIMADKFISFVNCQRYIRHRDIWDFYWLKQHNAKTDPQLLEAKIIDYKVENYLDKLNARIKAIDAIINGKAFLDEIHRFIPITIQERTTSKQKFLTFLCSEIKNMLLAVKKLLSS